MTTPLFSVESWVGQYFGRTPFALSSGKYSGDTHKGLDIYPDGKRAWDLLTPGDGWEVKEANWHDKFGNNIVLYNKRLGVSLHFAHLDKITVKIGDHLRSGQMFGVGGNTGNSTGRHVHIGMIPMRPYGVRTFADSPNKGLEDPLPFLIGIGVHI